MCPRCKTRGQVWKGSEPKCGFEDGTFHISNWNCATLNQLRDLVEETEVYSDDQFAAVIPHEGCFVVLGWYKHRGKTEVASWMDGETLQPITLEQAESVLNNH